VRKSFWAAKNSRCGRGFGIAALAVFAGIAALDVSCGAMIASVHAHSDAPCDSTELVEVNQGGYR